MLDALTRKYKEQDQQLGDQYATSCDISDDEMDGEEQGNGGTLTEFPPMSVADSNSEQDFSGLREEESGNDGGGGDWV